MTDTPPQTQATSEPMAKPAPKQKPNKTANGFHSEPMPPVSPAPADYETLRKEGWIADSLIRIWPMLVAIACAIFAVGRFSAGIDGLKEKLGEQSAAISSQSKATDALKSSFADFRVEWAAEQAKTRKALEDLAVVDDRQKPLPVAKKRVFHKPASGIEGLFH